VTNLEALQGVLGEYAANGNALTKSLIDQDLLGADTYTTDNKDAVNSAAIDVLNGIIYSSVSEGGYSVSYNVEMIKAKILALGGGPKVNGVKVW
jgi:hypothetical protein